MRVIEAGWSVSSPEENCLITRAPFDENVLTNRRQLADARLIAAAPELLDSLKTLVRQIDEWENAVQSVVGKRNYPWSDLEEARNVIAKAEGKHG